MEVCISLEPETDSNPVGTEHTVTATVTEGGVPVGGFPFAIPVVIFVFDGPNRGESVVDFTDSSGQVTLTYTGDGGPGTDTIRACIPADPQAEECAIFNTDGELVLLSDEATKEWLVPILNDTPGPPATAPPGPIGAVVAGTGGFDTDGGVSSGLWAVISTLFAGVAAGMIILGWRNISLARAAAAVPGMMPVGQLLRVQVQPIEGFPAFVDALRALSRMPGVAQAHAVRLWQGDGTFAVTLSAPVTLEALARKASAALGRTVRVK